MIKLFGALAAVIAVATPAWGQYERWTFMHKGHDYDIYFRTLNGDGRYRPFEYSAVRSGSGDQPGGHLQPALMDCYDKLWRFMELPGYEAWREINPNTSHHDLFEAVCF